MAGFVAAVGGAMTGLAAGGAAAGPAVPALWPNAEAVVSIMAMATMVVVRMEGVLIRKIRQPERRQTEIDGLGRPRRINRGA
jgi:hypothetical protein